MDPALVDGRYEVVRLIGAGGMTRVLEAWDRQEGHRVALKVPIQRFARDPWFMARLQREIEAVAGFAHRHVAAVHALEAGGRAGFVVAELVDGSCLRDMLAARGPLPPAGAAGVAVQVCAALAAAHARGLTHGHLVTANVLLAIDGRVKVTDFRLAQAANPLVAAPDPGADLQGVGRCLAAMLTGREPIDGEPIRFGPEVPAELAAIVTRVAAHPDGGYNSATDLGRDLNEFLAVMRAEAARAGQPAGGPARGRLDAAGAASASAAESPPFAAADTSDGTSGPGLAPPDRWRRRRRPAVPAALVGVALVLIGLVVAGRLLGGESGGPVPSRSLASPPTTVTVTTARQPPATRPAPAMAPLSTAPPATASPSVTTRQPAGPVAGPGQRIVPDVVGLHRRRAADVLAQARLDVRIVLSTVREPGQVKRVIAQQPPAGQVVPADSAVTVVVGTRRPTR
jgi:eukaryotic-like serine/threonine-protein kinase